ncbi:MAG: hypothetical protein AAF404_21570 [Pseudomonadota bacterium]
MPTPTIPQNYHEWKHCIIVECGLQLTPEYISERIVALKNPEDYGTKRFIQLYGDIHLERVIGWFEQARQTG